VYPLLPSGRLDYARVIPCRCASDESEGERLLRLRKASGDLGLELLSKMTFDSFDPKRVDLLLSQQRNLGDAYRLARRFAEEVPDLLDHLRATFRPQSDVTTDELFEWVKAVPLLILDDFGEQASTPWAQEKLYQIISHRYNARLPMVVTTSLLLEDIEQRIVSRIVDPRISVVFNIDVTDYRADHSTLELERRKAGERRRDARRW